MSNSFTPADEKALSMYAAYLALVRSLQIQGTLDLPTLMNQLNQAQRRHEQIGETGAAKHLHSLQGDVARLAAIAPPSQQG